MNILDISMEEWLKELFEHEYCAECGGDAEHHTAIPFLGNWFARCDFPFTENDEMHPIVKKHREAE